MIPVGHEAIVSHFDKLMERGTLGHAYCFVGQHGVGKMTTAVEISCRLLECTQAQVATHMDVRIVRRERDQKTGKQKRDISVDQIEVLRSFLSQRPMIGERKVVIIEDAEHMSRGAANALLKSLEEPRGDTILFLLTHDNEAFLLTIRSRVQDVYFLPARVQELKAFLETVDVPSDIALLYARQARGISGVAVAWAREGELFETYQKQQLDFINMFGASFAKKQAVVEPFLEKKEDHIEGRAELIVLCKTWRTVLRDILRGSSTLPDATSALVNISGKRLAVLDGHLVDLERALIKNIHPRLLIENFLLALP
jgi:DNA polymerase III subunit delta'